MLDMDRGGQELSNGIEITKIGRFNNFPIWYQKWQFDLILPGSYTNFRSKILVSARQWCCWVLLAMMIP